MLASGIVLASTTGLADGMRPAGSSEAGTFSDWLGLSLGNEPAAAAEPDASEPCAAVVGRSPAQDGDDPPEAPAPNPRQRVAEKMTEAASAGGRSAAARHRIAVQPDRFDDAPSKAGRLGRLRWHRRRQLGEPLRETEPAARNPSPSRYRSPIADPQPEPEPEPTVDPQPEPEPDPEPEPEPEPSPTPSRRHRAAGTALA